MKAVTQEKVEIRQAGAEDVNLLSVLGAVTFYESYFEQDDPPDLADYIADAFNVDKLREEIADPDSTFFVVYHEGRAVGYARLIAGSREPCITAERTAELKRIYIVERLWRRGIGEILLDHCVREARRLEMDSIWLGVWQQNARALPFYEKHGFVKVGTLEFPYADTVGINDVMEMKL